mmetsp:Transcript_50185/g.80999  ORF Transcript_50185/g.80999 Transcript_50185/m.80999 type:complete len:321 (-) Transcript_50185:114-1076(-)
MPCCASFATCAPDTFMARCAVRSRATVGALWTRRARQPRCAWRSLLTLYACGMLLKNLFCELLVQILGLLYHSGGIVHDKGTQAVDPGLHVTSCALLLPQHMLQPLCHRFGCLCVVPYLFGNNRGIDTLGRLQMALSEANSKIGVGRCGHRTVNRLRKLERSRHTVRQLLCPHRCRAWPPLLECPLLRNLLLLRLLLFVLHMCHLLLLLPPPLLHRSKLLLARWSSVVARQPRSHSGWRCNCICRAAQYRGQCLGTSIRCGVAVWTHAHNLLVRLSLQEPHHAHVSMLYHLGGVRKRQGKDRKSRHKGDSCNRRDECCWT